MSADATRCSTSATSRSSTARRGGDVRAVDQVNLALHAGEVVGLVGESGSGKSTLAYGACRLLRPPALITGGSVRYRGRRMAAPADILQMQPDELKRAALAGDRDRVPERDERAQPGAQRPRPAHRRRSARTCGCPRREADDKAGSLLDLVGIPRSRLRSYPHELSGGMRQRVMIAMALATDPEVVIMDEPTTALDVVVQRDILGQIVELKERLGFSILFITHDLSLLLELADRIAVMYAGQLLEVGTAGEIQREPAHPYTKGLLQLVPVPARRAPGPGRHPRLPARPARPAARLPVPAPLHRGHRGLRQHRHEARAGRVVR